VLELGFFFCRVFVTHRVCSGWTPLHLSAYKGNVDTCDILLKSGAEVNAKNKK
jgi:ankyrin repeat protein